MWLSPLEALKILAEARRSAEFLILKTSGIDVSKALDPLDPHDFDLIVAHVATGLKDVAFPAQGAAIKQSLKTLDVDWASLSSEQVAKVVEASKKPIKDVPDKILPKLEQGMLVESEKIVKGTKKSTIQKFKLNIEPNLSQLDDRAVAHVASSQGHYVRDRFGKIANTWGLDAKDVVAEGLKSGFGTKEIGEELAKKLGPLGRSDSYWDMIASVFACRARAYSQVSSFSEAGIDSFTWESVMDKRTSVQCRFLHGRTFTVKRALQVFSSIENAGEPEDIQTLNPFMSYGKTADGDQGLFIGRGENRQLAARVVENTVGHADKPGKFSHAMSDEALAEAGVIAPPAHGSCRSTIVPSDSSLSVPEPKPAAPQAPAAAPAVAPPPVLSPAEAAIARLPAEIPAKMAGLNANENAISVAGEMLYDLPSGDVVFAPKSFELYDLVGPSTYEKQAVLEALKVNGTENELQATVVKHNGKNLVTYNAEQLMVKVVTGGKVKSQFFDLDAWIESQKPKPVPAPAPAPAPAAPVAPSAPNAATIMETRIGPQAGSNEGGLYMGTDGVKRYVKFYADPAQAHMEHLANVLYGDLKVGAPKSSLFTVDGRVGYASEIIEGGKTFAAGVTKPQAKEFMKGFSADVLVGNRDAAGLGNDNVLAVGKSVFRIDNGGSFLYRAQAGRKPRAWTDQINEFEGFFDSGINSAYASNAKAAGYMNGVSSFRKEVASQIRDVLDLEKQHGGWSSYVAKNAPGLSASDQADVAKMLETRSQLLAKKLPELEPARGKKPKPKPKDVEGEVLFNPLETKGGIKNMVTSWGKDSYGADSFSRAISFRNGLNEEEQLVVARAINGWTSEGRKGQTHARVYREVESAFNKSPDASPEYMKILESRSNRWRSALDDAGDKAAKTPTHFDIRRGMSGDDFVKEVIEAWHDPKRDHVHLKTDPVASWSFSKGKADEFATSGSDSKPGKGTGVTYRWKAPIQNTVFDQVLDDHSFINTFHDEHEVIAGPGHDKGLPLPKEDLRVWIKGREYTYEERAEARREAMLHGYIR